MQARRDRVLIIGCNGQFGSVFARRFGDAGWAVDGADVADVAAAPVDDYVRASLPAVDAALAARLARADVVLLCVPEEAVVASIGSLGAAMADDAVLVDIASVRSRIDVAARTAGLRCGYVGLHPMFGPTADFAGRAVCVVPLRTNPAVERLLAVVRSWGCAMPVLDAASHDRVTSYVQVAPHAALIALGRTLAGSGVPFETVWSMSTPVLRALLAMAVRVVGHDRRTHWSIQTTSADAAPARAAVAAALATLDAAAEATDFAAFDASLDDVVDYLGSAWPALKAIGDAIVADTERTGDGPRDGVADDAGR